MYKNKSKNSLYFSKSPKQKPLLISSKCNELFVTSFDPFQENYIVVNVFKMGKIV
jgi:hypothetical protein